MLLAPPDKTQAGLRTGPEQPERLPTQHMGMHVKDGLPSIVTGVEDHPIPTLEHTLKLRNAPSGQRNVSEQLRISSSQLPQVPVPLLGHHEHMNPSLRPNIPKSKGRLILIDDISGDLTSNDPLEERLSTITHAKHPTQPPRPAPPHQTGTERHSRGVRGLAPGWGSGGLTPRRHTRAERQPDGAKRS